MGRRATARARGHAARVRPLPRGPRQRSPWPAHGLPRAPDAAHEALGLARRPARGVRALPAGDVGDARPLRARHGVGPACPAGRARRSRDGGHRRGRDVRDGIDAGYRVPRARPRPHRGCCRQRRPAPARHRARGAKRLGIFGGRDGTISMTLEPRGRQVALVVKDNGPGIPDSILPHVFEAFSSTKSISAGLGLGLAIVKDIVDRHQGQVTIESSGAGTTVTFLFDGVDEAVGDGQRATRKRVLLVEDNVAVHETYRLLLGKSGFEVVCATDADEALLLITRDTVDAVVVDVQMAGRDGLALVEALANWHTHLLPKVTLHTAYAYEDRVRAVADRYGIGLLEKPCAWDKLLETVTRLANTQL